MKTHRTNPDDVAESQPLPTPSVLAGPNLEHSDVEITNPAIQPQPVLWIRIHSHSTYSLHTLKDVVFSSKHLTKDFSYGDQFIDDKPSEANNEKTTADTEAESMVYAPPTTTTSATTTITLPLPPQLQQGPSDPIIIKRIGELEELIANLVEENQALETRLHKQGNRINKLETMDLTQNDSEQTEETKKKSKQDSPKTPPRSPPSPPPNLLPPPSDASEGIWSHTEASDYAQAPPPPPPSSSTHQGGQSTSTAALSSSKIAASAEYSAWTTTGTRIKPLITMILDDLYMDDETTTDEQAYPSGEEVGHDISSQVKPKGRVGGNLS
ncbi:hypothetical protein Tco_1109956 [Tanacetum coccineum]|uniref:Uncharacterized protein n=1 Tax=Tanacetum coccineum TaxID=301880 RepID=A0ABQ5IHK9_9ASTR